MSRNLKYRAVVALLAAAGTANAAIENIPTENGWGGWLLFGGGYTDLESNTVAGNKWIDVGNDQVGNLTNAPESDDTAHITFSGDIRYTFGDQWQAFIGTSVLERLTLDFTQQAGIRKQTDNGQKFSVGLLFGAVPSEVWQDPYQTSDVGERRSTDRDSSGIRLEWDAILGTGANLILDYRDIEIDKERIGQFTTMAPALPGGTCNAACQNSLRRDGDFVRLEAAYAFRLSSRHLLRPAVRWVDNDRDGDAQDNDGYSLLLTWSLLGDNFTLVASGAYSDIEYDNANPIYGIKQDNDGFLLDSSLFYNLTQDGRWQAVGTATYGESDSDIDFHDNELFAITLNAVYRFGNAPNRFANR